jgi:outer membrane lipoprotein carrier protein
MMFRIWRRVALLGVLTCSLNAWGSGLEQLQSYLQSTRSGDYRFEQITVSPDNQARQPQVQMGRMRFVRPGLFRFDYLTPFPQQIVADGQMLWFYDPDLMQVSVRNQAETLADAPAGLLATATDLNELRQHFILTEQPSRDGLSWVKAIPKNEQAVLTEVQVGLQAGQLKALKMLDAMGQSSSLKFEPTEGAAEPNPRVFQFVPPPGADILRP